MSDVSLCNRRPPAADANREFWRRVLLAGGLTALPRWTLDPKPGIGRHEATLPDELVAALRRLADEMRVPIGSVLLTAHARVLSALSGDREVWTGYAAKDSPPLPCRLATGSRSWRGMLLETHRAEVELLSHADFPVDDLRRELGLNNPLFETVFNLTDEAGELAEESVLQVGFLDRDEIVLRLRYRTDVIDADCAARIAGYHVTALALLAGEPDAEHARQTLLSPDRKRCCPIAGRTSCSNSALEDIRTPLRRCTKTGSGRTGSSIPGPIGLRGRS